MPRRPPDQPPPLARTGGRDENSAAYVMDDNGHSTALSPGVEAALVANARKGYWPAMCALLCRVAPSSVQNWLEKGLDEYAVNPYKRFAENFIHAELESCAELEDMIRKAALGEVLKDPDCLPPDVKALQWLLERRYSDLWSGGGQTAVGMALIATSPTSSVLRAKALEFLRALPEAERTRAHAAGLTLPT